MSQSLAESCGQIPYSENFHETLKRMESKARSSPDAIATLVHLLLSLLDDPDASEVMRRCNIGIAEIDEIKIFCGDEKDHASMPPAAEIKYSADLQQVLLQAATAADRAHRGQIDGAIVLAALVGDDRNLFAPELLRMHGLTLDAVINCLVNKQDDQQEQSHASDELDPFASLRNEPESSFDDNDFEELGRKHPDSYGAAPRPRRRAGPPSDVAEIGAASDSSPYSYRRPQGIGSAPREYPDNRDPGKDRLSSLRENVKNAYGEEAAKSLFPNLDYEEPEIETGKLVENIPRSMRIAVPVMVEARIALQDSEELCKNLAGDGDVQKHQVYVSSAMTVQLRAPGGGFTIESISPDTQWIENKLGLIDNGNFGAWRWTVTPTERGARKLQLVVSARTTDKKGMVAESPLPDQIIEVDVKINYGKLFKNVAGWVVAGIGGGALGKYGENIVSWF